MSKQRIRWIVALMAIGLLGLVGLQLFWIGSALRLQKEQFAYKVTDALQEVVRTLERQEIVYLTKQRIQAREQQDRLKAIAKKEGKSSPSESIYQGMGAGRSNRLAEAKHVERTQNLQPNSRQMTLGMTPASPNCSAALGRTIGCCG
jgi:two-component system phosphate regulon sensor histidine kinase PhoR